MAISFYVLLLAFWTGAAAAQKESDKGLRKRIDRADMTLPTCPPPSRRPECQPYVDVGTTLVQGVPLLDLFGYQPIWHIYGCLAYNRTRKCLTASPNATALAEVWNQQPESKGGKREFPYDGSQ